MSDLAGHIIASELLQSFRCVAPFKLETFGEVWVKYLSHLAATRHGAETLIYFCWGTAQSSSRLEVECENNKV